MKSEKIFLLIGNKIFPFVALPILFFLWMHAGGIHFTLLVLGLPLLFGYIAPGIGTNVLKMWRFRDDWMIGNFFIHHGFIYAATFGSVMYFSFVPPASGDWLTVFLNVVRCAGILGFVGWTHDTIAIREGVMEVYNEAWKRGAPAEVIAAHYAPLAFALIGACYAGIITTGYQTIVLEKNPASLWWLLLLGLAVMTAAISLPFLSWFKQVLREQGKG